MECRVEFDYTAQEDDELSLKKGDIILNVVQKMDGWWEGSLNGKTGMFPDNFVKVIEKSNIPIIAPTPEPVLKPAPPQNNVILRSNSNKSRRLRALFSYSPEQDDELRLDIGDVIDYIAEVEEGWWRGKLKGKVGIFPSNFVAELDSTTSNGKTDTEPKQNDLSKQSQVASRVPDVIPPAPPTSEPPPMEDDDDNEPPPILPPKPVREQAECFYPYQAQNEDELGLTEGDIVTIISKTCDDEGWWRGELRGKTGLFPDNFVRIISANEASNTSKPSMNSTVTQGPKISPQERNLIGVKPINSGVVGLERSGSSGSDKKGVADGINKGSSKKSNGTHDSIDGIGSSKAKHKDEGNDSVSSKVQRFSYMNLNPGMKPATPTSPLSGGGVSAFSLPTTMNSSRDDDDEEVGDFNAVERGENKLSHLTAGRAKAPRRRPPSTVMGKEEEENGINGTYNSHDSIESPSNHSTPYNLSSNNSMSQNITPSNSMLDSSNISENGSVDGGSSTKAKKVPPWMEELKKKQDKKALNSSSSPNTSIGVNVTASPVVSSTSLPHVVATSPASIVHASSIEKEMVPPTLPVKAPPLPAKPSTIATAPASSIDKSPAVSPSAHNSGPPIVANRVMGKKPPAPGFNSNINHSIGNDVGGGGGDSKNYVSYEDYAKLRDRVIVVEGEIESLRRQVKLLLERELSQGHIV